MAFCCGRCRSRQPDRLVQVAEFRRVGGAGAVDFGDLQEFRAQSVTFERFSGYEVGSKLLEINGGYERVTIVTADRDFFPLLGVAPLGGRTFVKGDAASVAVISAGLWERQFARDPSAIGRTLALTGNRWDPVQRRSIIVRREYTIIGVMPEAFQFPYGASSTFAGSSPETRTDLWIPDERPNGGRFSQLTGRLKAGVTVGAAVGRAQCHREAARRDGSRPVPRARRAGRASG